MYKITYGARNGSWNEFLEKRSDTTLYHKPEWKDFIEDTFKFKPLYLFSHDEDGTLNGILPLFFVDRRLTGRRICSVPFGHICGALGSDDVRSALYSYCFKLYNAHSADLVEIRDNEGRYGFHTAHKLSTYVLDIREDTYVSLNKSIRRYVNKARRANNSFRTRDKEMIRAFYEVNSANKKRNRVTSPPKKFFLNMARHLGDDVVFHMVENGGDIIGGGVSLAYTDDILLYHTGASHPKHLGKAPSYSYLWDMVEFCLQHGIGTLDFGPARPDPDDSLTSFKLRWGCREEKMLYSYYPNVPYYGAKEAISSKLIGMMPSFVYKLYSDLVFSSTIN